jgi:Ca2+-binding RTX toxin-like protein
MANVYTWSLMEPGTYEFDPETDQLIFDDDITASGMSFSPDAIDAVFSVGGKTVTLSTSPYSLTDANVAFTNGGMLLIGDNTTAIPDPVSGGADHDAHTLVGGAGGDLLVGGDGDDHLIGGDGDDVLHQTAGADRLDGGDGFNDRLFFSTGVGYGGATGVNVNLDAGTSDGNTTDGTNALATFSGIEQVFGTVGDDVLTGGSLARGSSGGFIEAFRGNGGNDTINGSNDDIVTTQGAGTAQGAFGVDRVEYTNSPFAVVVNLGSDAIVTPYGTVSGGTARDGFSSLGGGTDTLLHVNFARGSNFADTLVGGNPEYDTTFERFEGRRGNDYIDGGSGRDEANYQSAFGAVSVSLATGTSSGADGADILVGIEWLRGSGFADTLTGSNNASVVELFFGDDGNDTIDGGAGIDFASWRYASLAGGGVNAFIENGSGTVFHVENGTDSLFNIEGLVGTLSTDTLAGGLGGQWLRGNGGADTLNGGAGKDWADYSSDPGAVTVKLATGSASDGWGGIWEHAGVDTLVSIENVLGSLFKDRVTGNGNANILDGNNGNDTLDGKGGADVLKGGGGDDLLVWQATDRFDGGAGRDTLKSKSADLDLTRVPDPKIRNVEQIDLTGGVDNRLTVKKSDVLALSTSTNVLKVLGAEGDSVDLRGNFSDLGIANGFHKYKSGAAIVLVDTDVNVI